MTESTAESNNFIFDCLTLYNFKMHRNTQLKLSEFPITVISGANGSGKTQLLEGLILAIGHTPTRVSLSTFRDLIGPFDNFCSIQLDFNNPYFSDFRIISSADPELSKIINHSKFSINLSINSEGNASRWVISESGERISVTRKQIQKLMRSIGIYEDTMLNFTEEGYLGSFAEGSPHKKLEALLVATGLKEIYSSYLISKKRVDEKEKEISPLVLQLEKEKRKLDKLKENFERFQKKKDLINRFEFVERELIWHDFKLSETQLSDIKQDMVLKEQELEELKFSQKEKEHDLKKIEEEYRKVESDNLDLKLNIQQYSDNLNRMKGQKFEKTNQIKNKESQISVLDRKIDSLKELSSDRGLKSKLQFQNKLETLLEQIKLSEERKRNISAELKQRKLSEQEILERINDRSNIFGELSEYERHLVKDCTQYKEKLNSSQHKNELIGPIYEVITVKPEYKKLETVIKAAIGKYLFSFVAISHESYAYAKKVYDELFPGFKPNFTVSRVLDDEKSPKPDYLTSEKLESKHEGIIDYVVNLVDAPNQVKIALKKFVRTIVADSNLSANLLTDLAKQYKTSILTSDCNSLYLPQEAFTRPPRKYSVQLNTEMSNYISIERVREQLNTVRSAIEYLSSEQREILGKLTSLEYEKRDLEANLKPWMLDKEELGQEFIQFEKQKIDLLNEIKEATILLDDFDESIESYEVELKKIETEYKKKSELNNTIRDQRTKIITELERIESRKEKTQRYLDIIYHEHIELQEKHFGFKDRAEKKGNCPETIRENREDIFSEFNQIKGQLELLEITSEVTQETIETQQKQVQEIENEYKKNEIHLRNLRDDLVKRINEWEGGLNNIVSHLNRMLNFLLQDVFENIIIKITNYNDERSASLLIEAQTKGDSRNYRQLSGGEKTLIAQAIILALHMINQSPIHAIDEFTQKLDKRNRSLAFSMALATYKLAKENRSIIPQFILITPMIDNIDLSDEFTHKVLIESKVSKGEEKT